MNRRSRVSQRSLLAMFVALSALRASAAFAHVDPSGCSANRLALDAGKNKGTISNGETVTYTVELRNNPSLDDDACSVTGVTVGFQCPDANGIPGAVQTLATGVDCTPDGSLCFTQQVQCAVNVNPGVLTATARAKAGAVGDLTKGRLHDSPDDSTFERSTDLTVFVCTPSNQGAVTSGESYGLNLNLFGMPIIPTLNDQKSTASAPNGSETHSMILIPIPIPGVANLGIFTNSSMSEVTSGNAVTTATATVADVDLLGGMITATSVKGVSQSMATGSGSSHNSNGSTFENLVINGTQYANVAPNTLVEIKNPLDPTQVVARVVLYEENGSAGQSGGLNSAKFTASHSVNMIHVTVLQPLSLTVPAGADIIVAHAESSAEFPDNECLLPDSVSAAAFAAFVQGSLGTPPVPLLTVQQGDAEIPFFGGSNSDHIESVTVPGALATGTADDKACGSLTDATTCGAPAGTSSPFATSRSTVQGVNALGGAITADALDVSCQSIADGQSADTAFAVTLANLTLNGQPLDVNQNPNATTTITLPDGHTAILVLNEQIENSSGGTDTEGDVNAVHAILKDAAGLTQAEVIIAHAHCDAHKAK